MCAGVCVCKAGGGGATETPAPLRAHVNEASARGEEIAAPRLRAAARGGVCGGTRVRGGAPRACATAPLEKISSRLISTL